MHTTQAKLVLAALMLAALLAAPRVASDEVRGTKAYVPPMVIPAAAFINNGEDPAGFDFRNGGIEGTGTPVDMMAPVYLPDNATVTGLGAYIYDNTDVCGGMGRENVVIFLVRTRVTDGLAQNIVAIASRGARGSVEYEHTDRFDPSRATVNNLLYQYWIHMQICASTHRVNAVVIEY